MKEISRINHIGLRVSKLETARAFYEQLGFVFLVGPTGPEPVAIMEHPSGININFILNAAEQPDKNQLMDIPVKYAGYTHVAFQVSDMQAVINQLSELNIPLSGEPMTHPTGTSIFIRDQDRNVVEFLEPAVINTLY